MNSNKVLIGLFVVLFFLLILTLINLNHSKIKSNSELIDDLFVTNIQCIPEIIRSYEKVKAIYDKRNVLIFRYVNTTCSTCNDIFLADILAFQEEIGKDHIWIFPAYPNDRNSRILLSNELSKYNYKNIPADSLLIPTYKGELRSYFAWVNNEGEIDLVFIPDRLKTQYTRKYFQVVKNRLQTTCFN